MNKTIIKISAAVLSVISIFILSGCGGTETPSYTDASSYEGINYPVITGSEYENINKDLYAFIESLPGILVPENTENSVYDINYEIKCADENYFSIVFSGYVNVPGTAHPNNIFISRTYDMKTGKYVKPSELISSYEHFAELIYESAKGQLDSKIYAGFTSEYPSPDDLVPLIEAADSLTEQGVYGAWTYMGENTVGISLSLPHALGDYALIEISSKGIFS